MDKIKIGYAPTRRSIFSAPDAVKYRGLTAKRLEELGVDFVDITDINDEGLLYNDEGLEKIIAKFKKEKVDGLFLPHCNFGTEYECARLAKALDVPVLLWGPLDERPEPDGTRLRDTQCGLFATGKVLRRFRVPFTYMTNCRLNDPAISTVGMTTGITRDLNTVGRIIIIIMMYCGRIGSMTFVLSFVHRPDLIISARYW